VSAARPIHRFCRDAYLLARFGGPGEGRPGGRAWEQAVSRGMWIPGLNRRQHAGTLGLFGRSGHSGAHHELDGAAHGSDSAIWLEAKARRELHKADVAVFAFKCLDLYRAAAAHDPATVGAGAWWPILVSSEPCSAAVHRSCLSLGVLLCEPSVLPIPTLMAVAARPAADMHLDDMLLAEIVRIGERVCHPMQMHWRLDTAGREIRLSLDEPGATDIGDLLFVQTELTDAVLDYYDLHRPGDLESRGGVLGDRLLRRTRVR
jgi:hypothetical protein